ncbi:MAG: DUF5074 domain-containing protein [Candidatus Marithrix sp.]
MKNFKQIMLFVAISATIFISCEESDDIITVTKANEIAYVVNYGSYSGSKSEISIYNIDSSSISHDAYKNVNFVDFTSNIQSMAIHNDIAYFMSNNGDKIDIVDAKTLTATVNPISTDITKPRYFAATENTAYISCWGDVQDWSLMATSYIAKIDLITKSVSKIALPGGAEGLIIVNNKLYVGLSITNKVAVIDLASEAISYITVSAVPQQFVQDGDGNIWVSLVSKYSTYFPSDSLGLVVIDPKNNIVIDKVDFASIGGDGYIHISSDKNTIYAMGSEEWPGTATTIYSVNVANRTLSSTALISGGNFYGFNVNPVNEDIYVLISPSSTENGTLKIYNKAGILVDEETTGVSPNYVVFYNIN